MIDWALGHVIGARQGSLRASHTVGCFSGELLADFS